MGLVLEEIDVDKIGESIVNGIIETISTYKLNGEDVKHIANRLREFADSIEEEE